MRKAYVIALDQGTTSSRAMLVDADGRVVDAVQNPFPQRYPQPGWVEHDPLDILSSQLGALAELTVSHGLGPADIDAIGITNQRETTVVWNRETGRPGGQRHRVAVPPHGPHRGGALRRPGRRPSHRGHHRPRARRLLLGQQGEMAAGQRSRRPR